jgi:Zn ribbon nucleic-acid-binding protein
VSEAAHGTSERWHSGCKCTQCRAAHSNTQRVWRRARARKRLPVEVRQQFLDAIYAGHPFRTVIRDLGLTSNRVWGLTKTDQEWSENLEAALTATRRDDIEHGTNAAYVAGCVCSKCREHQRIRMARSAAS